MSRALTASILLLGMTLQGSAALAKDTSIIIDVSVTPNGQCEAQIGDQKLPLTQEGLGARLPELVPDKGASLVLRGQDAPYRCIGGIIFALQRLRYESIIFAAEPPPLGPEITSPPPAQ